MVCFGDIHYESNQHDRWYSSKNSYHPYVMDIVCLYCGKVCTGQNQPLVFSGLYDKHAPGEAEL